MIVGEVCEIVAGATNVNVQPPQPNKRLEVLSSAFHNSCTHDDNYHFTTTFRPGRCHDCTRAPRCRPLDTVAAATLPKGVAPFPDSLGRRHAVVAA